MLFASAEGRRLARDLLDRGIHDAEQRASRAQINVICVRALAGAAVLLGESDLADRATALLQAASDESFFAGLITNIELPKAPLPEWRLPPEKAQLERRYPPYSASGLRALVAREAASSPHVALCLEGRVQEARDAAGSDSSLEMVGLTLAVLGEFETARLLMNDPALPTFRQSGIKLVLAIELFRAGRMDEARALLAEMEVAGLSDWRYLHLALGFAGRIPWGGYPYPDW